MAKQVNKKPTGVIRLLEPHEIKMRVQSITRNKKAICLLYTDARVVMDILDEAFGPTNWQRKHKMIGDTLYSIVEVWDADKNMWVSKEDVGTESNTEATKGEASDSFKRSAVNWGVARELYTSPMIMVNLENSEYIEEGGRVKAPYFSLKVTDIEVNEKGEVSYLVLKDRNGRVRFQSGKKGATLAALATDDGDDNDNTNDGNAPAPKVATSPKTANKTSAKKPSANDKLLDEITENARVITRSMDVQEKVAWAKENIEPIAGSINHVGMTDSAKIKKLSEHLKSLVKEYEKAVA